MGLETQVRRMGGTAIGEQRDSTHNDVGTTLPHVRARRRDVVRPSLDPTLQLNEAALPYLAEALRMTATASG